MEKNNQSAPIRDVFELITNRVIEQLENGIIPWQKTWTSAGRPQNLVTKKPYRGINLWLLSSLGYDQNCFLTFKQVNQLGGSIRKGEKAIPVIFWKRTEHENPVTQEKTIKRILRYYLVFNVIQCENLPLNDVPWIIRSNNPIEECERIINEMPLCPPIRIGIGEPYYHPLHDYVNMPRIEQFDCSESFYNTLFHELIHSTGHKSRLSRKEIINDAEFGSQTYAIEELTAEMGACYLKSVAGFEEAVVPENVNYINDWLYNLRCDRKLLIYSGSQAQKAVDFITNTTPEPQAEKKAEVSI